MKNVAVFCGSSNGQVQTIIDQAYELGVYLAKNSLTLVYGGSKIGLMGQVAKGVIEKNGNAIGVIPDFLKTKEIVHPDLTELIVTSNMHERKVIMYKKSDAFIIIPGGFGTMDEFFEIATWGQLGLHSKPIAILNMNGYYDHLISQCKTMVKAGLLKAINLDALIIEDSLEAVFHQIHNYEPQPVPKWLNIDRV
ncbi:LOG family protein [Winogradskyella aurantiaca]|uniref:LOG family protein n=1 Tax=Winogradskyella aurantiaca TaxID=2219558 RepID=UPI000E1C89CB|nr:TIGR00730 family Rossman fold protein [Winogradskyella aurantiaca]